MDFRRKQFPALPFSSIFFLEVPAAQVVSFAGRQPVKKKLILLEALYRWTVSQKANLCLPPTLGLQKAAVPFFVAPRYTGKSVSQPPQGTLRPLAKCPCTKRAGRTASGLRRRARHKHFQVPRRCSQIYGQACYAHARHMRLSRKEEKSFGAGPLARAL